MSDANMPGSLFDMGGDDGAASDGADVGGSSGDEGGDFGFGMDLFGGVYESSPESLANAFASAGATGSARTSHHMDDVSLGAFHAGTAMTSSGGGRATANRWRPSIDKYHEPRAESGFVGLRNQGATCYLNSLIQALYMTPELRRGIYALTTDELGMDPEGEDSDNESVENLVAGAPSSSSAGILIENLPDPNRPPSPAGSDTSTKALRGDEMYTDMAAGVLEDTGEVPDEQMAQYREFGFSEFMISKAVRLYPGAENHDQRIEYLVSSPPPDGDEVAAWEAAQVAAAADAAEGDGDGDGEGEFRPDLVVVGHAIDPDDAAAQAPPGGEVLFDADTNAVADGENDANAGNTGKDEDNNDGAEVNGDSDGGKPVDATAAAAAEDGAKDEAAAAADPDEVAPADDPPRQRKEVVLQIQRLFGELQMRDVRSISTEALTTKGFGWQSSEAVEQHDVQELNRILFDAIEHQTSHTEQASLIGNLYGGVLVNQLICTECKNVREREETFQDLVLPVKGRPTIEDALAGLVDFETLDGDNQYSCEPCGHKVDARKGVTIRALPPVLILSLGRFEYDWQNDRRVKISDRCRYPLVLDMAPFMEEAMAASTSDGAGGGSEAPAAAAAAANAIANADEDAFYQGEINPDSDQLYDLFCVIIHQGGAYGGHYFSYIHDYTGVGEPLVEPISKSDEPVQRAVAAGATNTSGWFEFNDSNVTPMKLKKLKKQYGGKGECAYMLVYRRRETVAPIEEGGPIDVPHHLVAAVEKKNQRMAEVRAEIHEMQFQIELVIHSIGHYYVFDDKLVSNKTSATAMSPEYEVQRIDVDKRDTLAELKAKIAEVFAPTGDGVVPGPDSMYLHKVGSRMGKLHLSRVHAEDDATLADAGIIQGATLLAWDGTVEGEDWLDKEEIVTVPLAYYPREVVTIEEQAAAVDAAAAAAATAAAADGDEATDGNDEDAEFELDQGDKFEMKLGENLTIGEMKQMVAAKLEIPLEETYLCKRDFYGVHPLADSEDDLVLSLEVMSGTVSVTVERFVIDEDNEVTHSASKAWRLFEQRQKMIQVNITNQLVFPSSNMELIVRREISVGALKKKIFRKIQATGGTHDRHALETVRLRKTISWGATGTVFPDERVAIVDAGCSDGQRIIIEEGPPPEPDALNLRFVLGVNNQAAAAAMPFTCPKTATILECKTIIAGLLTLDPDNMRMKSTDAWDGPKKIFGDESLTLAACKIRENDLVWVEEGKPPVPGTLTLSLELYTPQAHPEGGVFAAPAAAAASSSDAAAGTAADDGAADQAGGNRPRVVLEGEITPPNAAGASGTDGNNDDGSANDGGNTELDAALAAADQASQEFEHYGESAQDAIDALLGKSRSAAPIPNLILKSPIIRLSTSEDIFAKLGRLEANETNTVDELKALILERPDMEHVTSIKRIRLWDRLTTARSLRPPAPETTLKEMFIQDGREITMQVLDEEEELAPHSIILYLHKRNPLLRTWSEGEEFVFDAGVEAPTPSSLRAAVSAFLSIPIESVFLAKYNIYTCDWREIVDETQPWDDEGGDDDDDHEDSDGDNAGDTNAADDVDGVEGGETIEDDGTDAVAISEAAAAAQEGDVPVGDDEAAIAAVKAALKDDDDGDDAKGKGRRKKRPDNLRKAPYSILDGDIIGIKDLRDDPAGNDAFTQPWANDDQDVWDMWAGGWANNGPSGNRPRPKEVQLKINY